MKKLLSGFGFLTGVICVGVVIVWIISYLSDSRLYDDDFVMADDFDEFEDTDIAKEYENESVVS